MYTPETQSWTYNTFYEKWKSANVANTTFEEAIKQWFYVLSYIKWENGYSINGITADALYEFELHNWKFSWMRKVLIDETSKNPFQDYLDAVIANIHHTWYISTPPASGYTLPVSETGLRVIPAEWMEVVQNQSLSAYIEKMEWTIWQHETEYKKRVAETIERGNQFL